MLLDHSGRPITHDTGPKVLGTMLTDADGPAQAASAPPKRLAREFFVQAHKRLNETMKSGAVTFGDTSTLAHVELVASLYAMVLTAKGPDGATIVDEGGREVDILGDDVTFADACAATRLVAASMRVLADDIEDAQREGKQWTGGGRRSPERQRAKVLDAIADAGDAAPWDDADRHAHEFVEMRAKALVIWATMTRQLLVAVMRGPTPQEILRELLMLSSEVQLLSAAQAAALCPTGADADDESDED